MGNYFLPLTNACKNPLQIGKPDVRRFLVIFATELAKLAKKLIC